MNKPERILISVGEWIGLIIGGLVFLFIILFIVAWLFTGPLGFSPNSPVSNYVMLAAFLLAFFPLWLMFRRRAAERPDELLRLNKYFFAYMMWESIAGVAGVIGLFIFAVLANALSYQLTGITIAGAAMLLYFFFWYKRKFDINQKQLRQLKKY